ncbi:MAG: 2-oxoacid:ferredoxin oxidoreductase subunit gamma [Clostridiales bacterium]|nr:2-oxoacid:ferredoxin oxidoreductase subunit gamma [Clostridiales bacterium]
MKTTKYLFSGFGGQGILFSGKFLAYKGLTDEKNVSWLPSYGPEMRGGTASCSVIVSDESIGSPIVDAPDVLIAMNLPSLDKFENTVRAGGTIILDSTLIDRKVNRTDVEVIYLPATRLASENNCPTLANMIIVGKLLKVTGEYDENSIEATLKKVISAKRADMLEVNKKAMEIGANYGD